MSTAAATKVQSTESKPAVAWRAYTGVTTGAVTEKELIERFLPLVRNVVDRIKLNLPAIIGRTSPMSFKMPTCSLGETCWGMYVSLWN